MSSCPPQISLARWNSYVGSSAGHWLIREVPWLAITGGPATGYEEWYFEALQLDGARAYWGRREEAGYANSPIRSLIEAWNLSERTAADQLLSTHPHLKAGFASRGQALLALSGCLTAPQTAPSSLSELLS
jgi:hypothetical protein